MKEIIRRTSVMGNGFHHDVELSHKDEIYHVIFNHREEIIDLLFCNHVDASTAFDLIAEGL